MAGHQHDALRTLRIGALENRIKIRNLSGLWNAVSRIFGETVGLHLETAATVFRVTLKFGLDPFPCGANAMSRRNGCRILHGQGEAGLEVDQLLDIVLDPLGRDLFERGFDSRIGDHDSVEGTRLRCGS